MSKELTERERIYKALKRPFDPKKISWRVGATSQDKTSGIALAYIDARDVMNRFDDVLGTDWQCKYSHANGKTICDIGILVDGNWIWRAGGAGDTDVEAEKGAISDAFKRAAVLFGVGRYLYDLPNEWVKIDPAGRSYKLVQTPNLPDWAKPAGFDCGLTPDGYVFGEGRKLELEDMANAVIVAYGTGKKEEQKQEAWEVWEKYKAEFKSNEEHMYAWFLLESPIRTSIKRMALINQPMKEAA
jgi:hypothetical protein